GTNIWLEVNGERTARRRIGQPRISYDPLVIGTFDGALDQFEIINPKVERSYVAYWPFEGDLRDLSGNGHDGEYARKRLYVEGHRGGRAMQGYPGLIKVAHAPELMLAPGL